MVWVHRSRGVGDGLAMDGGTHAEIVCSAFRLLGVGGVQRPPSPAVQLMRSAALLLGGTAVIVNA